MQHLKLSLISWKKCANSEKLESLIKWQMILLGNSKLGCFKRFNGNTYALYTVNGTIKLIIPSRLKRNTGPALSFLEL